MTLSTIDQHALDVLKKHGELILCGDGFFRANASAYASVKPSQIARLAALKLCRVEDVGESTFVVPIDGV